MPGSPERSPSGLQSSSFELQAQNEGAAIYRYGTPKKIKLE